MSQTVVLKVGMSCQGCSGAVKRVLDKMEGVEAYDIDLKEQKVTVKGNVQPEAVFQTVSKTGKKTTFWEADAPAPEEETHTEPQAKLTETPEAQQAKPAETPAEPQAKPAETQAEPEANPSETPEEPQTKPTEAVASA